VVNRWDLVEQVWDPEVVAWDPVGVVDADTV
jgi:hypothetical protein